VQGIAPCESRELKVFADSFTDVLAAVVAQHLAQDEGLTAHGRV
jgi:hypothetical protein